MKILERKLDCYLLEPSIINDIRGWFQVSFSQEWLNSHGLEFKKAYQLNHSKTENSGVVRGLNYQEKPYQQAKIIRCVKGKILSVAVDIDPESHNFGRYCSWILSSENYYLMYIPNTFAHGFVSLEDNVELEYFTDAPYHKESAKSLAWNDTSVGIDWTLNGRISIKDEFIIEKNRKAPKLWELPHIIKKGK